MCLQHQAEISASVTSGMRIRHNTDSLRYAVHRGRTGWTDKEDKEGNVLCTATPKLLNQEDDLCCRDCTGMLLTSHQSNPVDENPRTFKPFIVPSSGGVDTICYNNQGIKIYK